MQENLVELNESYRLQHLFQAYRDPKSKIRRLVQSGDLILLKRGLYARSDCADQPRWVCKIANRLYGPSYVSFEYALRWWNLIPEHVVQLTSASFKKERRKRYDTALGTFLYRDVPTDVYPLAVIIEGSEHPRFLIASPEKALCDLLYTISGIRSYSDIEVLLFDDLRIDQEAYRTLDKTILSHLSKKYRTETLNIFSDYTATHNLDRMYG